MMGKLWQRHTSVVGLRILAALASGRKHGYEIGKLCEIPGPTGTIYDALKRLECNGLVARCDDEVSPDGRIRHMYQITGQGTCRLLDELTLLNRLGDEVLHGGTVTRG